MNEADYHATPPREYPVPTGGVPRVQRIDHPLDFIPSSKASPAHNPEQPMVLPTDPKARKSMPITSGVLDYFPLAIAEVAKCSKAGNDQHNPGQPLHWNREKSTDHADCIGRHLIDRGSFDTDGIRHTAKLAWRALALLQTELEAAK